MIQSILYSERREDAYDMETKRRYIKIGIPLGDTSVLAWLDKQVNMSDSIRALIREDIEKNGYSDIFCREVVPKGKVGRPTNAELQMRQEAQMEAESEGVQERISVTRQVQPKQVSIAPNMDNQAIRPKTPQIQGMEQDEDGFVDPMALLQL